MQLRMAAPKEAVWVYVESFGVALGAGRWRVGSARALAVCACAPCSALQCLLPARGLHEQGGLRLSGQGHAHHGEPLGWAGLGGWGCRPGCRKTHVRVEGQACGPGQRASSEGRAALDYSPGTKPVLLLSSSCSSRSPWLRAAAGAGRQAGRPWRPARGRRRRLSAAFRAQGIAR